MTLRDAYVDLVLGGTCVGCARAGRLLCAECRAALPTDARSAWPTPAPVGLARPFAAAPYDGTVKQLLLGFKERGMLALGRPLAALLAQAVRAAAAGIDAPLVLVPVPSRPASVRARGLDSTYVLAVRAARLLRHQGWTVSAVRLLRSRPGVLDQAGLDAAARAVNLAGSMTCPSPGLRRLARRQARAVALVCDDVITTGATAREAQRALEAVGLHVAAIAAVAATVKRGPAPAPPPVRSAGPTSMWTPGTTLPP